MSSALSKKAMNSDVPCSASCSSFIEVDLTPGGGPSLASTSAMTLSTPSGVTPVNLTTRAYM